MKNKQELRDIVRQHLTTARYEHTLRVADTSVYLAKKFEADVDKAEIAAILHDYAKFRPLDEMKSIIEKNVEEIPLDLLDYHHELWHAFVGAYLVQQELQITDQQIVAAIRYHTTGRAGMSLLEKIVCLADYMEPGRTFTGVDQVRQLAEENVDQALCKSFENTLDFLNKKGVPAYPLTYIAFEHLTNG